MESELKHVDWAFELNPRMGGAAGEAYTNTLASSGMPPAQVLAREAIQNSVDARAPGGEKVSVDFVSRAFFGKDKASFVRSARLKSLFPRASKLGFKEPNCLADLDDLAVPLRLLYVDDYATTGLEGDPASPDSKFSRFLLSLGDGGKEHDEHGTGGSYGFGKSVYSSNSGILSIFAYSRTTDADGKALSLLFGCGYFRKHPYEERHYTGRAWFGRDATPRYEHAQQVVEPLRDAEADDLAAMLGFRPRAPGDLGTSVLIVDSLVSAPEILEGVEEWWWPRLISHQLDVRVISDSGEITVPRPRKREHLRPFLEAFDIATGKSPPDNKLEFRKVFNRTEGASIGSAGFKVLGQMDSGDFPVDDERLDSVALIRAPLMVVAYHRHGQAGVPPMAGAFMAADDIDDILRAAEPPAHDRWDKEARRLQDQSGRKKQIVERVLSGIRRFLKQSQSAASPPPPPRPKRLTFLERTLASFLAPSKTGTGPKPDVPSAPIHLTYDQEPRAEGVDGRLRLAASFSVRMKSDEEAELITTRVRVTCPVIEDGEIGESLNVTLDTDASLVDDEEKPGWKRFSLVPNKPVRFRCQTDSYDPLWTVRFVPEIEPVENA